jgi:hypothetical protein
VAARKRLADAVVACALPHPSRGDVELTRSEHNMVQDRVAGLRRLGAAALDLAWVAAGRFDAYWERGLSPWDMAAGIALVREAGGFVTDLEGREDMIKTGGILVANEDIHRQMLRALGRAAEYIGCSALLRLSAALALDGSQVGPFRRSGDCEVAVDARRGAVPRAAGPGSGWKHERPARFRF